MKSRRSTSTLAQYGTVLGDIDILKPGGYYYLMRLKLAFLILVLPLFVQTLAADSLPVEAVGTFSGGIYGTWDFSFASGPAEVYLEEITIDLSPTNVRFDTAPGGFGSLTSLDVGGYEGTDATTGLYQILPGTGTALDGGSLLSFLFNDFTVGDDFHFTADVDNPNPTLMPLNDCSGLGRLAKAACTADNVIITTDNDALLAAAAFVTAQQFSGAEVTYTFGGPGYYTTEFTGSFAPDGGLRVFGTATDQLGSVDPTPEPATCVSLVAGLLALAGFRLRRKAKH